MQQAVVARKFREDMIANVGVPFGHSIDLPEPALIAEAVRDCVVSKSKSACVGLIKVTVDRAVQGRFHLFWCNRIFRCFAWANRQIFEYSKLLFALNEIRG